MALAINEPESRRAFQSALTQWFARHGRDLPWRRTRDPYAVLVSEFMLQQTQVVSVLGYYRRWLDRFPNVGALARAEPDEALRLWEGLGYYARARNLHRAARIIEAEHGGIFPRDLAQIAALPGVGRYTAGAVATFAFGVATPIVDANIARVLARVTRLELPIDSAAGQRALWAAAESLLPAGDARAYNSALMELGALLCTSRQPQCLLCPAFAFCGAAGRDPERLPLKQARPATIALDENCAWVRDGAHLLLRRETGARWRGMWKLPPLDSAPAPDGGALFSAVYPFTKHRITLRVFAARPPATLGENCAWHVLDALGQAAMPAAHRRAVKCLAAQEGLRAVAPPLS